MVCSNNAVQHACSVREDCVKCKSALYIIQDALFFLGREFYLGKGNLVGFILLLKEPTIGFQVASAPCKSNDSIVFKVCGLEAAGNTCGAARKTSVRAVSSPPASSSSTAGTLRRTPPFVTTARKSPCRRRPSSLSSVTTRLTSWMIASSSTLSAEKLISLNIFPLFPCY